MVLARRDLVGSRLGCQRLMKGQEREREGKGPHFTRAEVGSDAGKLELFSRAWGAERTLEPLK